jgi:hypothetical protein
MAEARTPPPEVVELTTEPTSASSRATPAGRPWIQHGGDRSGATPAIEPRTNAASTPSMATAGTLK